MWSTSPAERILSVPPLLAQEVGVCGGAVEMPAASAPSPSPGEELPQPAARAARPRRAAAPTPASRPRRCSSVLSMVSPFVAGVARLGGPGVERVANAVPEEVESEHGEDEGHPREGEVPPGGVEDR